MLRTRGLGTEKIEDDIALLFPEVTVARMDLDTTKKKRSYEKIISDFETQRIQILVGTQMISKGLDFRNVSTVGILNADNMLNFPDFRAFERSFQLMLQVSGRAGRTKKRGKVIIQTSNPGHPVIQDVINNDYSHMFRTQLKERKDFMYPPFCRLIKVTLKHNDRQILNDDAEKLAMDLKQSLGKRVLGPEFPVINRIQKKYIKDILIKLERGKQVNQGKQIFLNIIQLFEKNRKTRPVQMVIDVDPM